MYKGEGPVPLPYFICLKWGGQGRPPLQRRSITTKQRAEQRQRHPAKHERLVEPVPLG